MKPSPRSVSRTRSVHLGDVADEAEIGVSCWRAMISPASSPRQADGHAGRGRLMAATMSRLTLPASTMRATSSVSASVTRRPSRNSGSMPSRAMRSPICGPPPWTTTGRMPTARSRTMSAANECAQGVVDHGVAAELHDDGRAREGLDVGQRLDQDRGAGGRVDARQVGRLQRIGHEVPFRRVTRFRSDGSRGSVPTGHEVPFRRVTRCPCSRRRTRG